MKNKEAEEQPSKGKLYLIPSLLGGTETELIPEYVREIACGLDTFIVENVRESRRYLIKLGIKETGKKIDDLIFHHLDKHLKQDEFRHFLDAMEEGKSIGLLSDAGCPAVADPGAFIIQLAHEKGIEVVPLVGPSSLLLALMGSGMNGQQFAFVGYLPLKKEARSKKLLHLEKRVLNERQTQIIIEAPYRNNPLLRDILRTLNNPHVRLCIAVDISLPTQFVVTKKLVDWRKKKDALPDLHKRPCVFVLGT